MRAVLVSRLRSNRDSDSRVKSGCSHLIRDGLTLYLGFWGYGGVLPRKKKIENWGLPNCWKNIEIVNPNTTDFFFFFFFCLCSFKSFTVPLGGPFFLLFFLGGGGGVRGACVRAWVNMIWSPHPRFHQSFFYFGPTLHYWPTASRFLSPVTWFSRNNMGYVCMPLDLV